MSEFAVDGDDLGDHRSVGRLLRISLVSIVIMLLMVNSESR